MTAEENVASLPNTNEVIGAYVPAATRIHLYSFLDRLEENAIYCDTNSVIFIQPSGESWPIATGDKLGDMQSELKPSEFLVEFASGGPKKYAYTTYEGEKTMKSLGYHAKLSRLEIAEFRRNQGHDFGTGRIIC